MKSTSLSPLEEKQLTALRKNIKKLQKVCVAYSGGVDSSLIAAIAKEQLGNNAIAVTGVSPSLAPHLLNEARNQAKWLGITHRECITNELLDPSYTKNPITRCFSCKQELHFHLKAIANKEKHSTVLDGVNHDDLGDYRPGIQAAQQAGVHSPLAELKIGKILVRKISMVMGLPWWNKPAQPCLASRFPYGEEINANKLKQVEQAEAWLRKKGFERIRVRSQKLSAKIELPEDQIEYLICKIGRKAIVQYFLSIGFNSVSIDLEGLVSGKLNRNTN